MDERRPISRSDVPFLTTIVGSGVALGELADRFLKWEVKQSELARIKVELAELCREQPSLDELTENIKRSWESYYQRAVARMVKFIASGAMSADYFQRLERAAVDKQLVLVPWSLCEDALAELAEQGYTGLPLEEKQKEVKRLQEKQAALIEEMETLLPAEQFMRPHPQSNAPVNTVEIFIEAWRSIQTYTVDDCDYRGITLREADPETRAAHAVLNLSALRSRSARLEAFVPPARAA